MCIRYSSLQQTRPTLLKDHRRHVCSIFGLHAMEKACSKEGKYHQRGQNRGGWCTIFGLHAMEKACSKEGKTKGTSQTAETIISISSRQDLESKCGHMLITLADQ